MKNSGSWMYRRRSGGSPVFVLAPINALVLINSEFEIGAMSVDLIPDFR